MARHLHVWRSHYLSGSIDFPSPSPFKSVTSGLTQLPDATCIESQVRQGYVRGEAEGRGHEFTSRKSSTSPRGRAGLQSLPARVTSLRSKTYSSPGGPRPTVPCELQCGSHSCLQTAICARALHGIPVSLLCFGHC